MTDCTVKLFFNFAITGKISVGFCVGSGLYPYPELIAFTEEIVPTFVDTASKIAPSPPVVIIEDISGTC